MLQLESWLKDVNCMLFRSIRVVYQINNKQIWLKKLIKNVTNSFLLFLDICAL